MRWDIKVGGSEIAEIAAIADIARDRRTKPSALMNAGGTDRKSDDGLVAPERSTALRHDAGTVFDKLIIGTKRESPPFVPSASSSSLGTKSWGSGLRANHALGGRAAIGKQSLLLQAASRE
jgi:hypothetical protein